MTPNGLLIIGSAGFVGSRLLQRLQGMYDEIYAISTRPHSYHCDKNIHVYTTSVDDPQILNTVLPRCRVALYLASHSNPGFSALKPSLEATSNLLPGLRFLETLQRYNQTHLIYVSSGGAIYGSVTEDLVSERRALAPVSYYGAGKASLEKFIVAYCKQSQGKATILRPTNFYGPGQPYKVGFGIIPSIFHAILSNKPLEIWGDGETVRDYLYIEDFVDLCKIVIEDCSILKGQRRIYNVGAERGTSVNQLCEVVEEVTGNKITKDYQNARVVDVPRSVLDCKKIQRDFNWKAQTDLHVGIGRAWAWYLKNQI